MIGSLLGPYAPDGKYLNEQLRNSDYSTNQVWEYIWLDDVPVAQIKSTYTSGAATTRLLTYIPADHLNTPRVMTDSTKKIVWLWSGDAYGLSAPDESCVPQSGHSRNAIFKRADWPQWPRCGRIIKFFV